ncbi:MAG: 1-acyl-sn-glycerol-3-phosphate acyltransferase [Firmicutes bacterium]|nr:1-acyl-sn-glycerol-3-phosphate acyltransferase [Bacillota bacterium]
MLYRFLGLFVRFVLATLYRWRVVGRERIPLRGGCVVVANHCNFFDPIVLGAAVLPRRIVRFMAKAEVFTWPVLGRLARWLYAFPVRRGLPDRQAITTAFNVVREGHVLGLFPEGTRHRDGRLHELRGGAAMVHLATGAPIVPVGLAGTERLKLFRFPRVVVWIGEPLVLPDTEKMSEKEAIAAINIVIRQGLEDCLARARNLQTKGKRRVVGA